MKDPAAVIIPEYNFIEWPKKSVLDWWKIKKYKIHKSSKNMFY